MVSSSRRGPERQCTRKHSDEVRPFSLRVGEADRLDGLISDVLEMSQLVSGGAQNFERAPTAPAVLVSRGLDRRCGRWSDRGAVGGRCGSG